MKKTFTLLCLLAVSVAMHAQNNLVCVRNSATIGGFAYCEIDLPNDTIYDKTLLPGYIGSLFVSTTADAAHSVYYACDGQRLFGINTVTDSVVLNLLLPLSASDYMTTIQYNPCDSTIYGLFTTSSTNQFSAVCSFRPSDSLFTANLAPASGIFHAGQEGAIDPGNTIYFFENGSTSTAFIGGYGITQGQVLFNTQVSPLNLSIVLRGIAYDCDSARVIGLAIHQSQQQTHLVTVDVLSGAITQLSSTPATNAFYFALGGSALDHTTGTFCYTSGQNSIATFDNGGNNYTNDTITTSGIAGLETMSGCSCSVSTAVEEAVQAKPNLFPNPCVDELTIEIHPENCVLNIYSATGQLVQTSVLVRGMNRVDVHALNSGVYFYLIVDEVQATRGSFVKE